MGLGDFRSVVLPYCLKKTSKNEYIVLNREYKPVGFNTFEHLEYKDYPIMLNLKGLTPQKVKEISWEGDSNDEMIFLYNDGCIPTRSKENMNRYLKRLEILAKLKIE